MSDGHRVENQRHLGIIVPLYIWPGAEWDAIIEAKRANPNTPITVIVNPSSGAGEGPVKPIQDGVKKFVSTGITSIGYVPTTFGNAKPRFIETSIENYREWYGLDGIFFDEVSSTEKYVDYYRDLTKHARSIGMKTCVANPGQRVSPVYHGTFDSIIVYEGPHLIPRSLIDNLGREAPRGSIAGIMYAVPVLDTAYVKALTSSFGHFYATEIGRPDPYKALPGYFSTMCSMVEKANGGASTGRNKVTVLTLDRLGNPISGIIVRAESKEIGRLERTSPSTFEFPTGDEVRFAIDENVGFDHWSGGDTSSSFMLLVDQDRVIAAYCRTRT
jgi:spherulation-specific family 4 protein